jgi:hypothetical protein
MTELCFDPRKRKVTFLLNHGIKLVSHIVIGTSAVTIDDVTSPPTHPTEPAGRAGRRLHLLTKKNSSRPDREP